MKIRRLFCAALVSVVLVALPGTRAFAQDPLKNDPLEATSASSALSETDADNIYRLGETFKISTFWLYWKAYAGQIPKRFEDFNALAKKADAPAPVIANIEQDRKVIAGMPWTKNWDQWNEDEKGQWTSVTGLNSTIWRDWLGGKPYDKLFFFYLGQDSLSAWYNIEKNINDGDAVIADRNQSIKDCLSSFNTMMTDSGYAHIRSQLNPEVLAAVKDLQTLHIALDDPLNGATVTQDTVTKIGAAGRKIRDLARAGKLLAK